MPIVIQVTREGTEPGVSSVTAEEKAALIKGASDLLLDVLKKPVDSTFVIIEEVEMENWGVGGLLAEFRKRHIETRRLRFIASSSDGFSNPARELRSGLDKEGSSDA